LRAAVASLSQSVIEIGGTPNRRGELTRRSGLSPVRILERVNHVDLFRVKGVGIESADLVGAAGLDTDWTRHARRVPRKVRY